MCGGGKSSSTSSQTNYQVVADAGATAVGAGGTLTVTSDNSVNGLQGQDLKTVTDFLAAYAEGAQKFGSDALDTIKEAQLNQKDSIAGSVQTLAGSLSDIADKLKWPLAIAAGFVALKAMKVI